MGGPQLPAPFEMWPFSPGFLNYFLDALQNNFSCSINLFWYLCVPSACVNLLPDVYNWCICVLKCRAKRGEKFLRHEVPRYCATSYALPKLLSSAPCSLVIFASCSWLSACFGPHSPGSLKPLPASQYCMFILVAPKMNTHFWLDSAKTHITVIRHLCYRWTIFRSIFRIFHSSETPETDGNLESNLENIEKSFCEEEDDVTNLNHYISPEVLMGNDISEKSDIW